MSNPKYILLTIKRVTTLGSSGKPGAHNIRILQPPLQQLFILPVSFVRGDIGQCEAQQGNQVLTFSESFDDVLEALDMAGAADLVVARPVNMGAIEDAVAKAAFPMPVPAGAMMGGVVSPLKRIADQMRDGEAKFVSPSNEERRAAEGAKHQDELLGEMRLTDADAATWGDFVQTDGENVGAPAGWEGPLSDKEQGMIDKAWDQHKAARYPSVGDMRIAESDLHPGEFVVEVCRHSTDCVEGERPIYEWTRSDVPAELRPFYKNREAAQTAVKLAGYSRRLWEE